MNSDEYYEKYYEKIVDTGAISFASNQLHSLLERNCDQKFSVVLELGAGKGQHLPFVKHDYDRYFETDIRIDNLPKRTVVRFPKVDQQKVDACSLHGFEDGTIDRLVASCLLVHLVDPERALLEWKRVVKKIGDEKRNRGQIDFYIPCEPGLLLRFVRRFTTEKKARKLGVNHLSFHYREHISFFSRLDLLVNEVFSDCSIEKRYWPLRIKTWNLNLGVFYTVKL